MKGEMCVEVPGKCVGSGQQGGRMFCARARSRLEREPRLVLQLIRVSEGRRWVACSCKVPWYGAGR